VNVFYLDKCPKRAAQQQCDKHVVKMILESAQMLSNHPSTVWARECTSNYRWLYDHMMALGDEYTQRYHKTHLTIQKCRDALREPPEGMPERIDHTQPPQCMPDEYKRDCSVEAYRLYYASKADTIDMRWTNPSRHFFNQQDIAA